MKSQKPESPKITSHHVVVFILTFLSYAFFHATRKTFSNVKTTISKEWTPSFHNVTVNETKPDKIWNTHNLFETPKKAEPFLGVLDGAFLISYAVGLYISGIIGDRLNMRLILSFGMCTSGISVFVFGTVFEWIGYYNEYVYVAVWICNGLLQSTGWPTVVAVMGNWFGRSSRGFVLGLWSACASVGNIIGALLASAVLDYGYDYAFLVSSTVLFAGGITIFFGLVSTPKELGLPVPDEMITNQDYTVNITPDFPESVRQMIEIESAPVIESIPSDSEEDETGHLLKKSVEEPDVVTRPQALSFIQALLLPGVILYALSYACLKFVNYSFFFWLPFYLSGAFGWKETVADQISICMLYHMPYALSYACLKFVNYSFFFWLPFYLSGAFGWKETVADQISIWYDVGGIIGGTIAGFISDRFQKRTLVVIPMLILAIPALFIYGNSPNNKPVNAILMTVAGFFVGGVANLISAAIAADLGRQGPIQGNTEALATVTGIIDGTGSVGAAIGQFLVPLIQQKFGWQKVFIAFMVMTFMTGVCILPLFIRECKDTFTKYSFSWYRGLHKRHIVLSVQEEED